MIYSVLRYRITKVILLIDLDFTFGGVVLYTLVEACLLS